MDLRHDLLADTPQICAEFADHLTLKHSRTCQSHIIRVLRRLIERKCVAKPQKLSSASTRCMQSRSSHLATAKSTSGRLNQFGVPPPKSRKGIPAGWTTKVVSSILQNERYRGIVFWNGTRIVRHPEISKEEVISGSKSEWLMVKNEDIRIVSEKLWEQAQLRFQRGGATMPTSRRASSQDWRAKRGMLMNVLCQIGDRQSVEVVMHFSSV